MCLTASLCGGDVSHVFKAVFAELHHEMQEDEHGEPQTPQHHLLHTLHVQHAEDEDELVEDEVPELIFQMLVNREEPHQNITTQTTTENNAETANTCKKPARVYRNLQKHTLLVKRFSYVFEVSYAQG